MFLTNAKIGYDGRLGNQLFQFASLFGIAKQTGKDFYIPIENLSPRLEHFHDGTSKFVSLVLPLIFPNVKAKLASFSPQPGEYKRVAESSFTLDQRVIDLCKNDWNIDLHGYFQSPRYFNRYREELLELLAFGIHSTTINNKPLVSIHVRRGDYLALEDNHPACSKAYYDAAIEFFPDCDFLVFSDDEEWCRKEFPNFRFSGGTEEEDLYRMSRCDHHIIANSSFSWWGAYLNKSKHKQIVAPKLWFGKNYQHNTTELLSIATKTI